MKEYRTAPWKTLSHKTVYQGRIQVVEHEIELPSGEHTRYEVEHSERGAVATLIKTADNKIVLSYQYRFPLNRWIYDLPGGAVDTGEDLEAAAIRECREEVGLAPRKVEKLATFYPNPGRIDWSATLFYCEEFDSSKLDIHDPSETVETVLMDVAAFKKLVDNQEIVDPSLLIAWYSAFGKGYLTV